MDEVCKELEELKAAMKQLKADYHAKTDLSESLKKAHSEQLVKIQEAKMEIEKQAQELNEKRDEISFARQMYEDLKCDLHEKESALRHLSSANDHLQTSCDEKLQKQGTENRKLVSALDEANAKTEDQEQKICAYKQEIEGLKGLLSVSQKKCLDAEERAKVHKELKQRDDMLLKLEQEKREVGDQLKWRNEQFKHLEEAHDKLHVQFQERNKEWELEKSMLLDEGCSLQMSLESQTRVSQDLRSQLQMCNQALAQEESRRKLLEIQLSESQKCYENVFAEFQGSQSIIESLTAKRDRDIAALRDSLAIKETCLKEMEFVKACLEQENQELLGSLKELQEAQINHTAAASLSKFRQKLRTLEQVHKNCSAVLKAKEAEWKSRIEKMETDLDACQLELNSKDKKIKELETELEGCHSLMLQLKSENEETSMVLMVIKSELLRAHTGLGNSEAESELCGKRMDERISVLKEQLEKKNRALLEALEQVEREREVKASLLKRVESDCNRHQLFLIQKELGGHKEMLQESSHCQERLKVQASDSESDLREDLRNNSDALDQANSDLVEKTNRESEIELQLERLKAIAERMEASKLDTETQLKVFHDENLKIQKQLEATVVAKTETEETFKQEKAFFLQNTVEKEKSVDNFRQQLNLLEQECARMEIEAAVLAHGEAEKTFMREKESSLRIMEEKDKRIKDLQQRLLLLEKERQRRETEASVLMKKAEKDFMQEKDRFLQIVEEKAVLASMEADNTFNKEKDDFLQITAEKDRRIDDLQQQILSLKQELAKLVETKRSEIDSLHKAWEKIAADWMLSELEIQDRNCLISEQEEEIGGLKQKLEMEEESLSELKKLVEHIQADLVLKRMEKEREIGQHEEILRGMESTVENLESRVEELKAETRTLLESNARLALEKDELVDQMMQFCDQIDMFSGKDADLIINLEKIVQIAENDSFSEKGENNISHSKLKAVISNDERSPLKALNSNDDRSPLKALNS